MRRVLQLFFPTALPCGSRQRISHLLTQTLVHFVMLMSSSRCHATHQDFAKAVKAISASQLPAPGLFLPLLSHLDGAERKRRGWRAMSHWLDPLQTPSEQGFTQIRIRNGYEDRALGIRFPFSWFLGQTSRRVIFVK